MNNDYFVKPELAYRKQQVRRAVASSRSGRSRSSWLRRLAAADKSVA